MDQNLQMVKVAKELTDDPGPDGWLTVKHRQLLMDFATRFRDASAGARFWALYNVPETTNDKALDATLRAFAAQLASETRLERPAWATGVEPALPPPIVSDDELHELATDLDRRGFRFLVDRDFRPQHPVIWTSRLVTLAGLIAVLIVGQNNSGLLPLKISVPVESLTAAIGGVLLALLKSPYGLGLGRIWSRLREVLPTAVTVSVTFPAMLGVIAFVYLTQDAWNSFGSMKLWRLVLLVGLFGLATLLILIVRLQAYKDPWRVDSDEETRLNKLKSNKRDQQFDPPVVLATLERRGLSTAESDRQLSSVNKQRLRIMFCSVLVLQVLSGVVLLAVILALFSFLAADRGALFAEPTSGNFMFPGGFMVSQAMLKVVAILGTLAGLFFVVVTLADKNVLEGFAAFERRRVIQALRVWALYRAAYDAVRPAPDPPAQEESVAKPPRTSKAL
jgi:hypothetical protein